MPAVTSHDVRAVDAVYGEAERRGTGRIAPSLSAATNSMPVVTPAIVHRVEAVIASARPSRALHARVDADHVDLAERGIGRVRLVDLQPVEAGEAVGVEREEEQRRIEPWLGACDARASSRVQSPCSACSANARLFTASHAASSRPGSNVAHGDAGTEASRPVDREAVHAHLEQSPRSGSKPAPRARRRRRRLRRGASTSSAPAAVRARRVRTTAANARVRTSVARAGGATTTPTAHAVVLWRVGARHVHVRRCRRRRSRPNRAAGCARSRQTASSSDGCPSATVAALSICSTRGEPCVTRPKSGLDRGQRLGGHRMRGYRAPDGPTPRREGASEQVVALLAELYPDAQCALDHSNAYELLVATILSAQCTDERVNMVTPAVFARYPTPADLAGADPTSSKSSCSRPASSASKAKNLIGMAQAVEERFGGEIPSISTTS